MNERKPPEQCAHGSEGKPEDPQWQRSLRQDDSDAELSAELATCRGESWDRSAAEMMEICEAAARRIGLPAESCEDFAVEELGCFWVARRRVFGNYEGRCSLRSYLFTIATRDAVRRARRRHLRLQRERPTAELDLRCWSADERSREPPETSMVPTPGAKRAKSRLEGLVRRLPRRQRQAVTFRSKGLSWAEVALQLATSGSNARALWSKGIGTLRRYRCEQEGDRRG